LESARQFTNIYTFENQIFFPLKLPEDVFVFGSYDFFGCVFWGAMLAILVIINFI